jgi:hypothetical protein
MLISNQGSDKKRTNEKKWRRYVESLKEKLP